MDIGQLNRRIELYGNTSIVNELDEVDMTPGLIATLWSAIIPQTGKLQKQEGNTILSNVTHKIIVRYDSGKMITPDMYFMYKGKRFNISYILNPYFNNISLEIFCEEVIE